MGSVCFIVLMASACRWSIADQPAVIDPPGGRPLLLDDLESVYAPPEPPKQADMVNEGGVHFDLEVNYLNDYIYRGLAHDVIGAGTRGSPDQTFDGSMQFDLGKFPHPFIGVFANVFNRDEVSKFEEVRPYGGLEWNVRPITIRAGLNSYIFPERSTYSTNEIFLKLTLDDSVLFRSDKPIFSPYVYGAYDYDKFHGTYLEAGLKHDFEITEWGLVITPTGDVGYSLSDREFAKAPGGKQNGFQHADVGMVLSYSLNSLFNFSKRYGTFNLKGYLFYTSGLDNKLRADTQLWGGAGLAFEY